MEEKQNHSLLSASTAHRWLVCTPSARLEQSEQGSCSVYAQEGTDAHELAEIKLSYRFNKITVSKYNELYDEFKSKSSYYNKEFEEYVDEFVEFVISCTENLKDYYTYFELKVNFSNIVPQGFGTVDVAIVANDYIHVIDLKFGVGVPVSALNNPQLRLYGMGLLNMFPNSNKIKMSIYQPRLQSTDTEVLTKKELLDWAINTVKPRADEAVLGEGILRPDEYACRFCKLRGKCKARADQQLQIAQKEFEIVDDRPKLVQNLNEEQLSNILTMAPLFENWLKDVKAYAFSLISRGVKIPGYKLVEGRSNRLITNEEAVKEVLLKAGFHENEIMQPQEMKGISALEAMVGKKLFAELFQDYLIKPIGKPTMVSVNDKRPELNTLAIAQEEFATEIEGE